MLRNLGGNGMNAKDRNSLTVMVVDDDIVDVTAITRALKKSKLPNPVIVASDGIEALEHLRGENGRQKVGSALVLLDLNMPRMSGIEFLEELRNDPLLRQTLVFVLTTSTLAADRMKAHSKNVAGYMLKSTVGQDFEKMISMLVNYWSIIDFPSVPVHE